MSLKNHSIHSENIASRILCSHLAYLNQEASPAKLKQRQSLGNMIFEFLSVVPHEKKFFYSELETVFNKSFTRNVNVSAYKAALAFETLERYATNLLSHPWRKEYKIIKLYGGFYRHSVEHNLLGTSDIFLLLGYKEDAGLFYLDAPVDPDRVAHVALDCLKAYSECQIMMHIYDQVRSVECSWLDILTVRQQYVCSVDEAVFILQQMEQKSLIQSNEDAWLNKQDCVKTSVKHNSDLSNSVGKNLLIDLSTCRSNSKSSSVSSTENFCNTLSSLQNTSPRSKSSKVPLFSNSKCPTNYSLSSKTDLSYLIEPLISLDDMSSNSNFNFLNDYSFVKDFKEVYEENSNGIQQFISSHSSPCGYNGCLQSKATHTLTKGKFASTSPQTKQISAENSYQPDSMQCCSTLRESNAFDGGLHTLCCERPTEAMNCVKDKNGTSKSITNFSVYSCPLLVNHIDASKIEQLIESPQFGVSSVHNGVMHLQGNLFSGTENKNSICKVPSAPTSAKVISGSKFSFGLSQDDVLGNGLQLHNSLTFHDMPIQENSSSVLVNCVPLNQEVIHISAKEEPKNISNHEAKNPVIVSESLEATSNTLPKDVNKWSCSSCTFYNNAEKNICSMCGRSRFPGAESSPLVSGGKECPQCTLVNKKDSGNCSACGTCLKDCPTYI